VLHNSTVVQPVQQVVDTEALEMVGTAIVLLPTKFMVVRAEAEVVQATMPAACRADSAVMVGFMEVEVEVEAVQRVAQTQGPVATGRRE
jgi:hypothetical protein